MNKHFENYFNNGTAYVKINDSPLSEKDLDNLNKFCNEVEKEFIKIGQEVKIPVRLGHIFSGDLDRKDKLFERLGMTKAGCVFVES